MARRRLRDLRYYGFTWKDELAEKQRFERGLAEQQQRQLNQPAEAGPKDGHVSLAPGDGGITEALPGDVIGRREAGQPPP